MAILIYCLIYVLATLFAIYPRAIPSKKAFFFLWLFVMVCLSLSSRLGFVYEPDSDYGAYALNMAITDYVLPYHAREFVFWLGSRYLHGILGDPNSVFIIMDLILFVSFYNSFKLLSLVFDKDIDRTNLRYLFYGAFLFVPYYTGFNGVYRQFLAIVIFLNALVYIRTKPKFAYVIFLISLFTHNLVIALAPFLVIIRRKRNSYLFVILASVSIAFVLNYVIGSDNEIIQRGGGIEIGKRISWVYLFILGFITVLFHVVEFYRSTITKSQQSNLGGILTYGLLLYLISFMILPSQSTERMFFAICTVMYPIFGVYFESHFRTSYLVRLLFSQLGLLTILFTAM